MTTPTPFSLPAGLSAVVAEACGVLPPLTKSTDETFIRMVFEETVDAFWRMYLDWLPKDARDAFSTGMEEKTGDGIVAWHKKYANFAEDSQARAKAEMILVAISEKLLLSIAKAYADWTPDEAAVTEDTWAMQGEAFVTNMNDQKA